MRSGISIRCVWVWLALLVLLLRASDLKRSRAGLALCAAPSERKARPWASQRVRPSLCCSESHVRLRGAPPAPGDRRSNVDVPEQAGMAHPQDTSPHFLRTFKRADAPHLKRVLHCREVAEAGFLRESADAYLKVPVLSLSRCTPNDTQHFRLTSALAH